MHFITGISFCWVVYERVTKERGCLYYKDQEVQLNERKQSKLCDWDNPVS